MLRTRPGAFPPRAVQSSFVVSIQYPPELIGDGIVTSDWTSEPAGLVFTDRLIVGDSVFARISGGAAGITYAVRNLITTAGGDTHLTVATCETVA